jgi:DNA-binding NtrC family response regulator
MSTRDPIPEGPIPEEFSEGAPTQVQLTNGKPSSISLAKMRLVVVDGADRGKELTLAKDVIIGGTFKGCDFVLGDKTVSRKHFEIRTRDDGFVLVDLGSTNGTYVDGYKIAGGIHLKAGTVFHVGKTAVRFQPLSERVEIPLSEDSYFGDVIGVSVKMREVFGVLEKIAPTDLTVLIEGPTGTGKDVIARSIHKKSLRTEKPFIVVDCGAIPRNLIESELFGHEKGSFTGAQEQRKGAFELADGGTIFLDEIGELPMDLQPKLLRALENREVRRIGGTRPIPLDVRILAATNRSVLDMVAQNVFREDLYFRLAVAKIKIPALNERKDDIPALVDHFLENLVKDMPPEEDGETTKVPAVTEAAMELLQSHHWPGNVRELRNVVERAVFLSESGTVDTSDILLDPRGAAPQAAPAQYDLDAPFKDSKTRVIEAFERAYLRHLLTKNKGNISRSAREAQIERKYLKDLLRKHGMRSAPGDKKDGGDNGPSGPQTTTNKH